MDQKTSDTAIVLKTLAGDEWRAKYASTLPPGVSAQRFESAAITAVRNYKDAADVDRGSLYNAVIQAAQQGLLPDGRQGALVTRSIKQPNGSFRKEATFMKMVGGVIDQLHSLGFAAYAVSVHANDELNVWNDDKGQHVEHKPVLFGEHGERVGALAVATKNGVTYVAFMNRDDLDKARAASKAKDSGPWVTWPDRMEQKSALHRLARRLPQVMIDDDDTEVEQSAPEVTVEHSTAASVPAPTAGERPRGLQAVMESASEGEMLENAADDEAF